MVKTSIVLIFSFLLFVCSALAESGCKVVGESETTYWSNTILSTAEAGEGEVLKQAKGIIIDGNGKKVNGVLVELFVAPGWRRPLFGVEYKKRRVAACRTTSDGKFYFPALASERYELVISKEGFNTSSLLLTINPYTNRRGSKRYKILF